MEPIAITIFHTNDMHAHIDAMARLSSYARRMRTEAIAQGRTVFFWDAGDAADRRSQLCSLTKGAGFSSILNAMGYSLQTMGFIILSLAFGTMAQSLGYRVVFLTIAIIMLIPLLWVLRVQEPKARTEEQRFQ